MADGETSEIPEEDQDKKPDEVAADAETASTEPLIQDAPLMLKRPLSGEAPSQSDTSLSQDTPLSMDPPSGQDAEPVRDTLPLSQDAPLIIEPPPDRREEEVSDAPSGRDLSTRSIEHDALEIIDANKPIKALADLFDSLNDALVHYAAIMGGRHGPGKQKGTCECDGRREPSKQLLFHWRVPVRVIRKGSKGRKKERKSVIHTAVSFSTAHWVCARCMALIAIRRLVAGLLSALAVTLFMLAGICTILFLNEIIGMMIRAENFSDLSPEHIMILSAGMLMAAPGALGLVLADKIGSPRKIREVGKPPFRLLKVNEIGA